jgi:hypothetical protein
MKNDVILFRLLPREQKVQVRNQSERRFTERRLVKSRLGKCRSGNCCGTLIGTMSVPGSYALR